MNLWLDIVKNIKDKIMVYSENHIMHNKCENLAIGFYNRYFQIKNRLFWEINKSVSDKVVKPVTWRLFGTRFLDK